MDQLATALADAIDAAVPTWVERAVERVLLAQRGAVDPATRALAERAGRAAAVDIGTELRALLAADIDTQTTTPLSIARGAVRYATNVLREAGASPVPRDEYQRRYFPDDEYDLTPASWADFGSEVFELGIAWGAAKAHVHLARHGGNRP